MTSGSELAQAQDIESHKRFIALCREFEILDPNNSEMSASPPMGQEKTAQVAIEQESEVSRILATAARAKPQILNPGRWHCGAAVLAAGAKVLGALLAEIGVGRRKNRCFAFVDCRWEASD